MAVSHSTSYHDAANQTDPSYRGWSPGLAQADAELSGELEIMRARSRDLDRNNGLVGGAKQTQTDHVVGTGLRLQSSPDYRALGWSIDQAVEWGRQVEAAWRDFAESDQCDAARTLDFAGLTSLVFRQALADGEALAVPRWRPGRLGCKLATCLSLVDVDRLSNPNLAMDTVRLRGGIERDADDAPVAYHIRNQNPWQLLLGGDYYGVGTWRRIPARTPWGRKLVIHLHDKERTGQGRGKPFVSRVAGQVRMADHYQTTELKSAIVSAMIAAFIESNLPQEQLEDIMGASTDKAGRLNLGDFDAAVQARRAAIAPLQGGRIINLPVGDSMKPFAPNRPGNTYAPFMEHLLRHIAAGLNMSYETLARDFSKTNYSSARAALLMDWRFFLGRRSWLAKYWCQPVFELWLEEAIDLGLVKAPGFYENRRAYCAAKWIGPGRGWVDPVKEATAAKIRMVNNLSTLQMECAEQGQDYEEVLLQTARERKDRESLNLPEPGQAPGVPAGNGAANV